MLDAVHNLRVEARYYAVITGLRRALVIVSQQC